MTRSVILRGLGAGVWSRSGATAYRAGRAIQALAGAFQAFEVVEQGDGVFQPGRVVKIHQRLAAVVNRRLLHMAGGGGCVFHFTETAVAQ